MQPHCTLPLALATFLSLSVSVLAAPIPEAISAYETAITEASNTWHTAVSEILSLGLSSAEDDLAAAKVAGNTSRQARAIATRNAFQKALDSLPSGSLEWPTSIRRDIRPILEKAQSEIAPLTSSREAAYSQARTSLREAYPEASDEAAIAALLHNAHATAQPTPSPNTASPSSPDTASPTPDVAAPYASNGEAASWAPLLGVAIEVADVDIVTLPILNVRSRQTLSLEGALGPVSAAITPLKNILSSPNTTVLAFRASNVPGFPNPDITEWPSAANNWTLQLRCRPGSDPSKPNALTLEVDARTPSLTTLRGGEAAVSSSTLVPVSLDTRPSGAAILINGRPLLSPDGSPLRTPAEIQLPPEGAALELRLSGYLPKSSPCVKPPANRKPVTIPLAPDPDFLDKTLTIRAASASAMSGITLKQGRKYRIQITGSWSCDPSKTLTSCEGYPLDQFPALYTDPASSPRLTTDAPYGALLFAIGKSPTWRKLPPSATLTADSTGPLRLDINEGGGPRNRTNNTGSLTLHIRSL